MTPLWALHRIAELVRDEFTDWRLSGNPAKDRRQVAIADWPYWAAAMADVSGQLDALPEECSDAELLAVLRAGYRLVRRDSVAVASVARRRLLVEQEYEASCGRIAAQVERLTAGN